MLLLRARAWFASAVVVLVACSSVVGDGPDAPDGLDTFYNEEVVGSVKLGATKPNGTNGDSNYCDNPMALCTVGEGDCDSNAHCQAGLICIGDNGSKFGFTFTLDMCAGSHCNNGILDGNETAIDCGGSCSSPGFNCATYCSNHYWTQYPNGHSRHCANTCPCPSGQGDCDGDVQCQAGTVCINNNGDKFGFPGQDFCAPATCRNGVQDAGEAGIDCGGPCSSLTCGQYCAWYQTTYATGHNNHCTNTCRCASGEGDCDSDAQCQPGNVCINNNGNKFGFPGLDFCAPATCRNGVQDAGETFVDCGGPCSSPSFNCGDVCTAYQTTYPNGHNSHCTATCRCASGHGDCDGDAQCQAGLVCINNNGDKFGFPGVDFCAPASCRNGVLDAGETAVDCGGPCSSLDCATYCASYQATYPNSHNNHCTVTCPCASGEGDCDGNAQCQAGLVCGNNNSRKFNFPPGIDFCVPPHCINGVQDAGETAIDCGGACGSCGQFEGIGDLPGGAFESYAHAVSVDGGVVVGRATSANGSEAFRWTVTGGMQALGDLAGGAFSSVAYSVSNSGAVVVGQASIASGEIAFRWTPTGGMVSIGDLPGGSTRSEAYDVSADGLVIVGPGISANGAEAFRYAGAMTGLGDLPGGIFLSQAWATSGDGSYIVGRSRSADGYEAFRWTSSGGMQALGDLAGGIFLSHAMVVSANGAIVAGYSSSASGIEAFRWTASGMVGLGYPPGMTSSYVYGISDNGSRIVGTANDGANNTGFIWTSTEGMQDLQTIIQDQGGSAAGWTILGATGISGDGKVIVGYGINPLGDIEAFRAVIP